MNSQLKSVDFVRESFNQSVKKYKDYPKEGVLFFDLNPVYQNPVLINEIIESFFTLYGNIFKKSDVIFAVESRGFIFASILSFYFNKPLVLVRKKGKLPGELVSFKYDLEYGSEELFVQVDALREFNGKRALIFDDVIATGGTMNAVKNLISDNGLEYHLDVEACLSLISLKSLPWRKNLKGMKVRSFVEL